ncbi:malto-oligosyltrehalose trehalohydrolase [Pelagibacterium montanilacus]|uniref:malto-oligosyltrehalose trehalohydrolase n=1 Tax=Pelagibacterium montanilacus TaxID=2185280 RepID=UPI000F8C439B|nr:malto-oligosyltrehalose trehalohydrolase [Pelagibacterium montanilacus]
MTVHNWGFTPGSADWTARLWAPEAQSVKLVCQQGLIDMQREPDGYWVLDTKAEAGMVYGFSVDGLEVPDPASRLQAGDVHGRSVAVDHGAFAWQCDWRGRDWAEAVIYEMHVGTFTPEGTFSSARVKLEMLAELGFTAIEIMPVGQFPGDRGWGYDGVLPFAPHPAYGTPDDLKRLVDHAHSLGLMVMLDVVMNHFGPDGAYLHATAPEFFDKDRHTPWGAAIDFSRQPVRDFWIECALMWIVDYRFDGLRLDAVHQITGPKAETFFAELAERTRAADPGRQIHLVVEDESNDPELREAFGYDATWNDDFHHAVHTALTGEDHSYYKSFAHDPIGDLALALERGHIEEGQPRPGRDTPRGKASGHLPTTGFVNSTQTHDQVGNRANGDRLLSLADPAGVAVAYALNLVAPYIPMVFMGEERGETAPFLFFADYEGQLAESVRTGRAQEFAEIASMGADVPDPLSPETFARSRIDWSDTDHARFWQNLTRDALDFRANHLVPMLKAGAEADGQVTVAGERALAASWTFGAGVLRIALNFGTVGAFCTPLGEPGFRLGDIERDAYALHARIDRS